ncbi:hypothetical protein V5T82_11385 [Magnetovibrio sp. PR-2]|uniref:hypothetical protein n=1 Tax=Magnetovibrio sp. PR-2 TaxID=3120356 RepID=UPI002FCDE61E
MPETKRSEKKMGLKDPLPTDLKTDLIEIKTEPGPRCLCHSHMADEATNLIAELAHPDRLMIMTLLHDMGELQVDELLDIIGGKRDDLAQHLGHLREQCLITTLRKDDKTYYTLDSPYAATLIMALGTAQR